MSICHVLLIGWWALTMSRAPLLSSYRAVCSSSMFISAIRSDLKNNISLLASQAAATTASAGECMMVFWYLHMYPTAPLAYSINIFNWSSVLKVWGPIFIYVAEPLVELMHGFLSMTEISSWNWMSFDLIGRSCYGYSCIWFHMV